MRKQPIQLTIPMPKMDAAQRKAWIRARLAGYEFRQAARETLRRRRNRRAAGNRAGENPESGRENLPRQLSIDEVKPS